MANIDIGSAPPETILPPEPTEVVARLTEAAGLEAGPEKHGAVSSVTADFPSSITAWAELGDCARDTMEAYAAYRVGYHRGLDTLRKNGWRGSGFVRWEHPTNRGFLRALAGLARQAAEIKELDEAERCEVFLRQLDPQWSPQNLAQ